MSEAEALALIKSRLFTLGGIAAVGAGLVSFFSPCTVPLLPAYLSYLTGASYEELVGGAAKRRVLSHSLAFLLGFCLVFILLGASATAIGSALQDYSRALEVTGGVVLLLLGLFMMGLLKIGLLFKEVRWMPRAKPAGYAGSALVGGAFAAGWSPCVGPILAGILFVASQAEHVWQGMALLTLYCLGFSVPFLVCALLLQSFMRFIRGRGMLLHYVEVSSGAILVLVGALILGGWWRWIALWLLTKTFSPIL